MEKKNYEQSKKLDNVCYDIRGPVMDEAMRMEARGANILKLNIGNPAPFGFYAPDEVILDMIYNPPEFGQNVRTLPGTAYRFSV